MMDLPERKTIRLPDFDYSSPGAYFITICTKDRKCILSSLAVGDDALGVPHLELTETGKTVERYILSMDRMNGVIIDKYVIMPNHIHMILRIDHDPGCAENGLPRASAPTISQAVGAMKRLVHRSVGYNIWQRSFYEHVIRNEQDYLEIGEYIDQNPAKWALDRYYDQ